MLNLFNTKSSATGYVRIAHADLTVNSKINIYFKSGLSEDLQDVLKHRYSAWLYHFLRYI
jgi:hypothetical protein